ncbi:MAG: MFS transporter [Chloroflexota bacterium]
MTETTTEPALAGAPGASVARPAAALALPAALMVLALAYWSVDTTSPALPAIRDALTMNSTGAGLIISLFFGGRLLASLPAALMVDRAGPPLTAALGAALLGAGSATAALSQGEASMLMARFTQGAGVSLLATAGLLSLLRRMPAGGSAMTAFNVTAGLGGSVGLLAGGYLAGVFSWRAIFWQCVALSLVMLVGSIASAAGSRADAAPGGQPHAEREDRAGLPLASVAVIGALLANLLVFVNYGLWVVGLPLYAAAEFAATPSDIGNLLLVVNAVHIAGAFPAGGVIRRAGAPRSLGIGLLVLAAGTAGMMVAPNPWLFVIPASLYAIGEVAGNSSAGDLLLRLGGGGGRSVGMVRITSDIGLVIGPLAAGMLVDRYGVRAPFAVFAALTLVGAVAALAVSARRGRFPSERSGAGARFP